MTDLPAPPHAEGDVLLSLADYNAFVNSVRLEAVETIQFEGERLSSGVAPRTNFEVSSSFATEEDRHYFRYDVKATLLGVDDAPVASLQAAVVVGLVGPAQTLSGPIVEHFAATSGAMMAMPYLRENVNSLAARLGYPGVNLPMAVFNPLPIPDRLD